MGTRSQWCVAKAALAAIVALGFASCSQPLPNTGLVNSPYRIASTQASAPIRYFVNEDDASSYGVVYSYSGPLNSERWTVVRGVRFSESELSAAKTNLGDDVVNYLTRYAPRLDHQQKSLLESGVLVNSDGSRTYHFVTARVDFAVQRSVVLGSPGSGAGVRVVNPRLRVWGSKLPMPTWGDSASQLQSCTPILNQESPPCALSQRAMSMSVAFGITPPGQDGPNYSSDSVGGTELTLSGIIPALMHLVNGTLVPAADRTFVWTSPWMLNAADTDHNLAVRINEKSPNFIP